MQLDRFALFAAGLIALFQTSETARAADIELSAVETATVYENGPRDGEKGRLYLNIEGASHGQFASFGYAVFDPSVLDDNQGANRILSLTLELTHAPSRFSTAGKVQIWLAPSPMTLPGNMRFDPTARPTGVGTQVGRLIPLIGNFEYDPNLSPGAMFFWEITATETLLSQIRNAIQTKSLIHLVITPVGEDVAATFAGMDWVERDTGRSGAPRLIVNVP